MANESIAKVTITAHHVAPEVERYLVALDPQPGHYNLLDLGWVREDLDANTAVFTGHATGRWRYRANIENYLVGTAETPPTWVGDEQTPHFATAAPAWSALHAALAATRGAAITIGFTDFDGAMSEFEAGRIVIDASGADLEHRETPEINLRNLIELLDLPLPEAVSYVAPSEVYTRCEPDGVEANFVDFCARRYPGQEPTLEMAEEFLAGPSDCLGPPVERSYSPSASAVAVSAAAYPRIDRW
ncbi:hypothetical protein JT358_06015 [Micrococcales bacterium 31B]|nr:hypothetical protein [Micrococcales bacterium 31B]